MGGSRDGSGRNWRSKNITKYMKNKTLISEKNVGSDSYAVSVLFRQLFAVPMNSSLFPPYGFCKIHVFGLMLRTLIHFKLSWFFLCVCMGVKGCSYECF